MKVGFALLMYEAALFFPLASSPSRALADPSPAQRAITAEDKIAVADAVRAKLKDPDSARFRWLPSASGLTYCGFVNSKNSFGGYTGFQPFTTVLAEIDGKPSVTVIGIGDPAYTVCSNLGVDMTATTATD